MTHVKPHVARFAAFFLVGALVMAPIGAHAAPSSTAMGGTAMVASDGYSLVALHSYLQVPRTKDDCKNGGWRSLTDDQDRPFKNQGDCVSFVNAGGTTTTTAPPASTSTATTGPPPSTTAVSGSSGNGNGANPTNANAGNADPVGVAVGLGAAPPNLTPSGVTPTQGGLGPIDARLLPAYVGAAIVMFDQYDEVPTSIPEPLAAPTGLVSGPLSRGLAPVLPPILMDAVAAPFVLFEALIDAMAASGQALVIPFLAGVAGFFAPGLRRKHLLAEALGQPLDSDS